MGVGLESRGVVHAAAGHALVIGALADGGVGLRVDDEPGGLGWGKREGRRRHLLIV